MLHAPDPRDKENRVSQKCWVSAGDTGGVRCAGILGEHVLGSAVCGGAAGGVVWGLARRAMAPGVVGVGMVQRFNADARTIPGMIVTGGHVESSALHVGE